MSARAVICHSTPAGATYTGAAYVSIGIWQQAPLDAVFTTQLNGDGTPATFATVASNRVTIPAGVYRIRGWSLMNCLTGQKFFATRLYNVTAVAPAWVGKPNEISTSETNDGASIPNQMYFGGDLNLAVSTILEIQGLCNFNTAVTFGLARSAAGFVLPAELYRWMEIIKTV